jgi:hypothetical protein
MLLRTGCRPKAGSSKKVKSASAAAFTRLKSAGR